MENRLRASVNGATVAAFITPASAYFAFAIALVSLASRWHSATPTAVPAAAVGALFAATALLLIRSRAGAFMQGVHRVGAVATLAIGLVALLYYATGSETLSGIPWWARPPGPMTGLGLALVGGALLSIDTHRRWAMLSATATLGVALIGLVGHAYGAEFLYGLNRWGGTAVSTGVALAALALGVLFSDPSRGFAAVSASKSSGGYLLRRLLPVALLAPLVLGWLTLAAENAGLVDAAYGMALLVVSLMVLSGGYVTLQAKLLNSADAERARLLANEQVARERAINILESIRDSFFAVDRDWRFTYINREAEALLQRPREELIGRNIWEEFPEAVGATFERKYQQAMAEQQVVEFEEYYPALQTWFNVRAYPAETGLSVYFHDVTARKLAEQRIRESEERYRLLADMIPQHIWTTDPDGYHNYFSRRWHEYTGMATEQTEGERWLQLLHPEDRERTIARWQHSLRTGEPYAIEYRFRGADGKYRWFLGQAMPLRNEAGEIIRWFGTLTDISETKRLEAERERLLRKERQARADADRRREELERVTESRARLIRGFSHDVRNPLGAADAQAWLLEDGRFLGQLSTKQQESVKRIRGAIRTSVKLLDDLLELAQAEAGQIELRYAGTDIAQAAREVAEDFRAQATAKELRLEVSVPEGLEVATDPVRVRQILSNLLSNAIKYVPAGCIRLDAEVRPNGGPRQGRWVAMSVTDTGPGIPQNKREVIFQEYTRLEPGAQQGTGIGLAISRRLAQLLGGDLTLDSNPGHGSKFTLWLPLAA